MIRRMGVVWAAVIACALVGAVGEVGAAGRPNVLFIAVDDLRPELSCYGKSHIKSPNLDKLAASGTVFRRAYCQQAVCSPSRTSLLTGLRPDTTKVYNNGTHFRDTIGEVVTLPQHFKNEGYFTQGIGKIYHGGLDDKLSWSVPWSTPRASTYAVAEHEAIRAQRTAEAKASGKSGKALSRAGRGPAWESAEVSDDFYADGKVAEAAVESLRVLKGKGEPFFLAVGFHKPHLPFIAPKRYFDLYDPAQIELAANAYRPKDAPAYALASSGELRNYHGVPKEGPISEEMARELRHAYYACVSYLDANVGRVLDELDRLGLRQSTIVIFWGDHGWKLGEHGEWCKHSNVQLDTHSPLIISAPGKRGGQSTEALVEFVDIYPTLCELAGLVAPEGLEGLSMVGLMDDPTRPWKTAAFSQYPRDATTPTHIRVMGYAMTTAGFRYTRWVDRSGKKTAVEELYDHGRDPAENVNVAGDAAYAEVMQRLRRQFDAGWRGATPR